MFAHLICSGAKKDCLCKGAQCLSQVIQTELQRERKCQNLRIVPGGVATAAFTAFRCDHVLS